MVFLPSIIVTFAMAKSLNNGIQECQQGKRVLLLSESHQVNELKSEWDVTLLLSQRELNHSLAGVEIM